MPKDCYLCGNETPGITLHERYEPLAANISLCPNCACRWVFESTPVKKKKSERLDTSKLPPWNPTKTKPSNCCLCKDGAVAMVHDFKMNGPQDNKDIDWSVCDKHLRSFIRLNLRPDEVKRIIEQAGCLTYQIHEDFYDEAGRAVQPK